MRKPIIAGNWKMNNTKAEAEELLTALKPLVKDVKGVDIVVCVPFTDIEKVKKLVKGSKIRVGETLSEREGGFTESILYKQIEGAFEGIDAEDAKKIVVAYEPVWAIGTGKTATSEQANDTIKFIRKTLAKKYGRAAANRVRIQYGGSMNAKNAAELMAMSDIDGGLIGGASLKAQDFSVVVKAGVKA